MTNKYLEKIAVLSTIKAGAKALGGIAKDAVKGVGNDVHVALGGGFRQSAVEHGVMSQNTLREISGKESYQKVFPKASPEAVNALQNEKNKAIIKTVGYATAAGYAGKKALSSSNQQPQYY